LYKKFKIIELNRYIIGLILSQSVWVSVDSEEFIVDSIHKQKLQNKKSTYIFFSFILLHFVYVYLFFPKIDH